MSVTVHERPGVYSSYDITSAIRGQRGSKVVGLAALASQGETEKAVRITSYEEGVSIFGEDTEGTNMAHLLRLLFLNGAGEVHAVRVADANSYVAAFTALVMDEEVAITLCDSALPSVQMIMRESIKVAAEQRRERIGIAGGSAESTAEMAEHAKNLNHERMVFVGGDVLDENGVLCSGVTPLETVGGQVTVVRSVTTKTTTNDAADATWRELTTILVVDDVVPGVRNALRTRFARKKNTQQTRGAIRSQVIMELENKRAAEIIDSYGDVTVSVDDTDPTVCLVEFAFAVTHGLNQIYLTAHITV